MTKHVMVDLETLGNGSNSVIVSIGAVAFNADGNDNYLNTFYYVVDPQSCVDAGLKIDVSTIMWWMKQSDDARKALLQPSYDLTVVLRAFSMWYPEGACFWGNGATFDNVILSNAYLAVKMQKPWSFTADRCYRTLKNIYPDVKVPDYGVKHNALDDAIFQAKHLSEIFRVKGLS